MDHSDPVFEIEDNRDTLDRLAALAQDNKIIPFLGAGFSAPACPCWGEFLDDYFTRRRNHFTEEDSRHYEQLKCDGDFEGMAYMLAELTGRNTFEKQLKASFDKKATPEMTRKFRSLYELFPGVKITANFDKLTESAAPPGHPPSVGLGHNPRDMENLFTSFDVNGLLKIHGSLEQAKSIVLTSQQYAGLYGKEKGYDAEAPLSRFLLRVFANSHVLFIGCSLQKDRIMEIMKEAPESREHFAVMRRPEETAERARVYQRLGQANITPVWITDFVQVEALLKWLLQKSGRKKPLYEPLLEDMGDVFVGREQQLTSIHHFIRSVAGAKKGGVIICHGAGGVGKTMLSKNAIRRFNKTEDFPDGCIPIQFTDETTAMSFAMMLATRLGRNEPEPPDAATAQALASRLLQDYAGLVWLDNVRDWQQCQELLPLNTNALILITTRNRELYDHIRLFYYEKAIDTLDLPLETFSDDDTVCLFRAMLGGKFKEAEIPEHLQIADCLGRLPIALKQAATLMIFGPKYPTATLLNKLAGDNRLEVLRAGADESTVNLRSIETVFDLSSTVLNETMQKCLNYLAICAAGPVPVDFLQKLSGNEDIGDKMERLYNYSWCDRREADGLRWYKLHDLVREVVRKKQGMPMAEQFFYVVTRLFTAENETVHFTLKDRWLPQLEEGLAQAGLRKDPRLEFWLYQLIRLSENRGYGHFYIRLSHVVEGLFPDNPELLSAALVNRANIFQGWGMWEEAMRLYQKAQQINEALGDSSGLAQGYVNQANILKETGNHEEAMSFYQIAQQIMEALRDSAGMAICYVNQANILHQRGDLEEAMSLYLQAQQIREALGDSAGSAICYVNQANILQQRGNLEEAMDLYQQAQQIMAALGDMAGTAACFGNEASILMETGYLEEAIHLMQKAQQIWEAIGDRDGLAVCYHIQGLILKEQRRLNDAMQKLQEAESIFESMRLKSKLAESYGARAVVLREMGKLNEALDLHEKEREMSETLKLPAVLASYYWNRGLALGLLKNPDEQRHCWEESLRLRKNMGLPTDKEERQFQELIQKHFPEESAAGRDKEPNHSGEEQEAAEIKRG